MHFVVKGTFVYECLDIVRRKSEAQIILQSHQWTDMDGGRGWMMGGWIKDGWINERAITCHKKCVYKCVFPVVLVGRWGCRPAWQLPHICAYWCTPRHNWNGTSGAAWTCLASKPMHMWLCIYVWQEKWTNVNNCFVPFASCAKIIIYGKKNYHISTQALIHDAEINIPGRLLPTHWITVCRTRVQPSIASCHLFSPYALFASRHTCVAERFICAMSLLDNNYSSAFISVYYACVGILLTPIDGLL